MGITKRALFALMLGILLPSLSVAHLPLPTAEDQINAPEDPLRMAKIKELLSIAGRQAVRDIYNRLLEDDVLLSDLYEGRASASALQLTEEEFTVIQLIAIQDTRLYDQEQFPHISLKINFHHLGKDWMEHFIRLQFLPTKNVTYLFSTRTFDDVITYFGKTAEAVPRGLSLVGFEHESFTRPVSLLQLLTRFCHDGEGVHLILTDSYPSPVSKVQQSLKIIQNHFERKHFQKAKTLHLNFPYATRYEESKLRLSQEGEVVGAILLSLSKEIQHMEDVSLWFNFINDRDRTRPQPIWVRIEKFLISPDQYADKDHLRTVMDKHDNPKTTPPLYHYRVSSPMGFIETPHFSKFRTQLLEVVQMLDHKAVSFAERRQEKRVIKKGRTLTEKNAAKVAQPTHKPLQTEEFCPIDEPPTYLEKAFEKEPEKKIKKETVVKPKSLKKPPSQKISKSVKRKLPLKKEETIDLSAQDASPHQEGDPLSSNQKTGVHNEDHDHPQLTDQYAHDRV